VYSFSPIIKPNFSLKLAEADDIIAYILSLKRK
jgi:hypothetical protein